jgi:transposase-like protein
MRKFELDERPRGRDELAAWYGEILEAQAQSGMSLRSYALQHGISPWTLYGWRRRLANPVAQAADAAAPPRLVELALAPPGEAHREDLVVRVCADRRSIAVPRGFDPVELRRLVEVLESC